MIAVIGATGNVGGELVRVLAAGGERVTAGARTISADDVPAGGRVVRVDLCEPETLRPLLEAVRDAAGSTPLLVKIAPDLPDDEVEAIARLAVDVGLAGLVATNTTISREGLRTDADTVADYGAGGLSGAPLKGRALEVLRLVRASVPDGFCVIAAGGVETAADVAERLAAGADLVQGYSAFIYQGPFWGRRINRDLARTIR